MVGRTGCKKTTFIQNLGRNKIFSDIKEYQTISKNHFPQKEKIISEIVLLIKKWNLNILKT